MIDSYADTGINPKGKLSGKVEFKDVKFSYPSRPDVKVGFRNENDLSMLYCVRNFSKNTLIYP